MVNVDEVRVEEELMYKIERDEEFHNGEI